MDYRTPLARARGLGASHDGTQHFIALRLTSWLLVPLTLWFVITLAYLAHSDYAQVMTWFKQPINAILFISFLLTMIWHASLGLQVIIEDYFHSELLKMLALMVLRATIALFAISGLYFIVRVTLTGSLFMTGAA